jgi:hypothetical protein
MTNTICAARRITPNEPGLNLDQVLQCRSVVIACATCRCARRAAAGDVIPGKRRHSAFAEVFSAADGFVGDGTGDSYPGQTDRSHPSFLM